MKPFFKLLYLLLFLLVGIAACEPEDLVPQPQNKLEANAGPDQQVVSGTLVSLDGSASKDGNSQAFTYSWILKSKPTSSTASLNEAATVAPTFTPDVAGIYVAELKIISTLGFATDEVRITATASSQEPSAIIISEDITEDRILEDIFTDAALADYIVTANVVASAKLTVKPGVRIEFEQDKGLIIYPQGALIAKGENDGTGTFEKRIAFTGKNSTKGYWKGILLLSNNHLNELEYVSVEYAGSSPFAEEPTLALRM